MSKEKFHIERTTYQSLIKEDRRYSRTLSPPNVQKSSPPHHMEKPTWAGELQNEFGTHRRGPSRNWY